MTVDSPQSLAQAAKAGIELCRQDRWKEGLDLLAKVFNSDERTTGEWPRGLVLSYLGYGIARFHNRQKEGLTLCERAVKLEFYQVDAQFNLARTQQLIGNRRAAVAALARVLKLDPQHAGARALQAEMGRRRLPVLGFLGRGNPINILLGRIRHLFSRSG